MFKILVKFEKILEIVIKKLKKLQKNFLVSRWEVVYDLDSHDNFWLGISCFFLNDPNQRENAFGYKKKKIVLPGIALKFAPFRKSEQVSKSTNLQRYNFRVRWLLDRISAKKIEIFRVVSREDVTVLRSVIRLWVMHFWWQSGAVLR